MEISVLLLLYGVTMEKDTSQLKAMSIGRPPIYDAAKDLLDRLCNELPQSEYQGRIIVERGDMLMGNWTKLDFFIVVHAITTRALREFVWYGVNSTKGIRSIQVLTIMQRLDAGTLSVAV